MLYAHLPLPDILAGPLELLQGVSGMQGVGAFAEGLASCIFVQLLRHAGLHIYTQTNMMSLISEILYAMYILFDGTERYLLKLGGDHSNHLDAVPAPQCHGV